jgi:bis(5'-nucleosyl)-tetraphosphatase (symmetrical)
MASYAIGDVQGCFSQLQALVAQIQFDPACDQLWFVGDLVNRGPDSLAVLRWIKSLGNRAQVVLGNHDLHLLAVSEGFLKYHRDDHLTAVIRAPDRVELLDWLRHRPLLHHDPLLCISMIHAGLPPQWTLADAQTHAAEVEAALQGVAYREFLEQMYGNRPKSWDAQLTGWQRLRFITNCFTRLRYCDADGRLALEEKGAPGSQPTHLYPWFAVPQRRSRADTFVFGHWSTLGFHAGDGVYALDTGCLWGGRLTALCLETRIPHFLACPQTRQPGRES